MSVDLAALVELASQRGDRRHRRSGKALDKVGVCLFLAASWCKQQSPSAREIAATTGAIHGARLYCGDGVAGKGGLQLDQTELIESLPADGDGAKPRKRSTTLYPPSRRNWAKVICALNELGMEPPAIATEIGFGDENELWAVVDAA